MSGKTLAITGVLTLALLAPAGAAVAAPSDRDRPGLGGLIGGLFDGDHHRDHKDHKKKHKQDRRKHHKQRHVSYFRLDGEIRSVDRDDREIVVDLGRRNRTVRVAKDAKSWRDGDRATLRDLRRGDDVRITGEKRDGRYVAKRVVAD